MPRKSSLEGFFSNPQMVPSKTIFDSFIRYGNLSWAFSEKIRKGSPCLFSSNFRLDGHFGLVLAVLSPKTMGHCHIQDIFSYQKK